MYRIAPESAIRETPGPRSCPDGIILAGGAPLHCAPCLRSSYTATFTRYGRPMMEYFVRVAGEKVYVMFFTVGSPEDINAIRADIDRMAESIRIP